jgi:ABC-type sugar transport system ATPase subunit
MEIQVEGLRFERENRLVLDIPSLRLNGGRTTIILGPNGAGKTTLLRLIAALERPGAGRILAGGSPVDMASRARQNVAYAFQEDVFLRQSVRENLALGLRLRGLRRKEIDDRIDEAAHLLGISHLLGRRADRLSGGEGRRAGLARALCLRAPLVLLDEPLAGLDPATYARLLDDLPQVLHAFRATTILVTHDRNEALRLGEDLVVLVDGRVHAAGGKREIVLNPTGPAVAEVLGYTVLVVDGRRVAVPPGALRLGPGPVEFTFLVEELLDLVERREMAGYIGDVRVHVTAPATEPLPDPGDRVLVHAERACDLPRVDHKDH